MQTESGGTVFDRGSETGAPGANACDGVNVASGAELVSETGSLRFVVGTNGIGKTTLLRILARGGAALGGDDIGSDASLAVKAVWSLIGGELFRWVAQTPFMW